MNLLCLSKSDHPDFGDESVPLDSQRSLGVERKLSAAGTFKNIVRKFTAQKSIELQDKPLEFESKPKLERKQSIVQSMKSMLKRKPSVILPSAPVLSDEEYEHLKKFDGIWYAQYEKNKHGNAEISRVMALGWGLKKALDNVPFFEVILVPVLTMCFDVSPLDGMNSFLTSMDKILVGGTFTSEIHCSTSCNISGA